MFPDHMHSDVSADVRASVQLYSAFANYRETVEHCLNQLNHSLETELRRFFNAQSNALSSHPSALFISQYALAQLCSSWGVQPNEATGQGSGSMVAACFNGTLSLQQALAQILDQQDPNASEEIPLCNAKSRVILTIGAENALDNAFKKQLLAHQNTVLLAASADNSNKNNDAAATLLKTLGELYFADVAVDWGKIYGASPPRRVPLPTYPFERRRYWFTSTSDQTEASATLPSNDNNSSTQSHSRPELSTEYIAPRNPIEHALVDLSQTLLGFDRIGVADNIADLGADSMFTMLLSKKN